MDIPAIVQTLQASGPAEWMRTSVKAMPVVEAAHVLAAATVFGTIFIVDLRLLGVRDRSRAFTRVSLEMLRYTWAAFALAVITGGLMFVANASTYWVNTAFQFKMLGLLLAGLNMMVFQHITARDVRSWDTAHRAPTAARVAGALSILLWLAVIFLARWIGFTKGYNFDVPDDPGINFEF